MSDVNTIQSGLSMITNPSIQSHPASVDAYIRHGWHLVPIPAGTKGPRAVGWNKKERTLKSQHELPPGFGIGLAHAYSGTAALDIDDWQAAVEALKEAGIDLTALYNAPDAVRIESGRQGHGKLLYTMPFGIALPSKKINRNGKTVYELRCATASGLTVQDVLPPSIHPDTGQPYRWGGLGRWENLPEMPLSIIDLWQSLLTIETEPSNNHQISTSWDQIKGALKFIPPGCSRDDWIAVGMALHNYASDADDLDSGLRIWNEWSAESADKYPGESVIVSQWKSFRNTKASRIKIGSLFHLARLNGWFPSEEDVSVFFTDQTAPSSPVTLTEMLRPPAPDMDMSLWPKVLADRANEVSEAVGCDPLVPLFAGIAAVCGVVDAQIRLELMPGFVVPPVLWLMTLGDPADKKSPGSRPMLSSLKDIEAEDRPRYQKELLDWEAKEAAYASAKKAFLEFAGSPEGVLGGQAPHVPDLPSPPVPVKITVSDITSQKLVRHAADRPRGVLCYLDEMNSWIRKLTDRSSGEDRSAWVVSYEAERYEMDRVGAGAIHADNLAVSIYGNIQPSVFRENLQNLTSDGLLQRFIPAILRSDRTRLGNPKPEYMTSVSSWESALRLIYSLPVQKYRLSDAAYDSFREFQKWYEGAKKDERLLMSSDNFMTAFGKLEGTAGRLILLFHILENPFSPVVEEEIIHRVIQIIKTYLIPAYRYALGEIGGVSTFDQWVADHIIHYADMTTITLSDIRRSARRQLENKNSWTADQMILNAMYNLEKAGWVTRLDDGRRENQHQADWLINPNLKVTFEAHRKAVIDAKQRMRETIYQLSTKPIRPVRGYKAGE